MTRVYTPAQKERRRHTRHLRYLRNRDAVLAQVKDWYEQNKARSRSKVAARSARTRRSPGARCPHVIAIYDVALAWRKAGEDVHVDHVVPLRGRTVSGLHVWQNLTIIPAIENKKKRNELAPTFLG